jgi:hypothetical protein
VTSAPPPDDDPQLELLKLLSDEFAAGGITSGVAPAAGPVPAQLMVDVAEDLTVHVCFLPEHDQPPVLQYLVAFEVDVVEGAAADATRVAALINASLPLTGFEVSESAGAVVFRYVQAVSVHPLDPGVVAWPLSMIHFAVVYYARLVEAACSGTPYAEVAARFEQRQAELLADE